MKPNRLDDFRAWPAQKAIDMVVMESLISDLSSRCSLLPPPPLPLLPPPLPLPLLPPPLPLPLLPPPHWVVTLDQR
jgi:hypothetical protein